jgi:hypothetical protein
MSKKLVWDQTAERYYETGIEQVALYPQVAGEYPKGVAWNGVTALNLTPSGAEPTPLYANNRKYLTLMSVEELGGTIEAFTYPEEWAECDGSATVAPGVYIGQQARKPFGLVGKTLIGNDTENTKFGYKLHIVYGGLASPSEQANSTINDSPEAKTMSWEFSTTPVTVEGYQDTSYICIDSTKVDAEKLKALEAILYGSDETEARLPLPDEVISTIGGAAG